jgi:flavin-dependent dehydrogenase
MACRLARIGPPDQARESAVRCSAINRPRRIKVFARTTVLATGAGIEGITSFDVAERPEPSAVALRAYFKVPRSLAESVRHLTVSYDSMIAPGYGWIFPGPNDVFNIGVGCFLDARRPAKRPALGDIWTAFADRFPPARDLLQEATQVSPLRGAPLRTAMIGSRLSRPGLLVVGAASLTYSFSGEGIGKAMASGIVAGNLLADGFKGRLSLDAVEPAYAARLTHDFAPRFREYFAAQRWLEHPRLVDFVIWRARRGAFVRRQLEGLFNETAAPRNLLSIEGFVRTLLQ